MLLSSSAKQVLKKQLVNKTIAKHSPFTFSKRSNSSKANLITKAERVWNIALAERRCQLTTPNPDNHTPNSSLVPFLLLNKVKADVYFTDKEFAKRSEEKQNLKHYEIIFLIHEVSAHNSSLMKTAYKPKQPEEKEEFTIVAPPEIREKMTQEDLEYLKEKFSQENTEGQYAQSDKKLSDEEYLEYVHKTVSLAFGNENLDIVDRFQQASRWPPRSVITANVQHIPKNTSAFRTIYRDHFYDHPNVSLSIKPEDVNMFRVSQVNGGLFMDISGEVTHLQVDQIINAKADVVCSQQKMLINRINKDPALLEKICNKGFGLKLGDKFVYSIDRYGMRLMAMEGTWDPKKAAVKKTKEQLEQEANLWGDYYLEYGYEIKDEAKIREFFMKFHNL